MRYDREIPREKLIERIGKLEGELAELKKPPPPAKGARAGPACWSWGFATLVTWVGLVRLLGGWWYDCYMFVWGVLTGSALFIAGWLAMDAAGVWDKYHHEDYYAKRRRQAGWWLLAAVFLAGAWPLATVAGAVWVIVQGLKATTHRPQKGSS